MAGAGAFDTWLTPPGIVRALGMFDLDPCAAPSPRPWGTAAHHIELPTDGLIARWYGRVWCNPPYGQATASWMERLAKHGMGTALVFARTETDCWHKWIWPSAIAILFIRKRLNFHLPDGTRASGNAGGPSALIAYGELDCQRLKDSGIVGAFVKLREAA